MERGQPSPTWVTALALLSILEWPPATWAAPFTASLTTARGMLRLRPLPRPPLMPRLTPMRSMVTTDTPLLPMEASDTAGQAVTPMCPECMATLTGDR